MPNLKNFLEERGWLLGRTLGEGGQARTYIVQRVDAIDSPSYVLKVLSNTKSQQALVRFQQEIEAIQRISHPGIVRIVDHSKSGDSVQIRASGSARTLARGRGSVWAAGYTCTPGCFAPSEANQTLIMRWNGVTWSAG